MSTNMSENPSLPPTETLIPPMLPPSRPKSTAFGTHSNQPRRFSILAHALVGVLATGAAIATVSQCTQVRFLERYAQTLFFNLRGPVAPPGNIKILAIDEYSLSQSKTHNPALDRQQSSATSLHWPFRRAVYADVIDKLMKAGAKSVAVDLLFADPSSYSPADDVRLQKTLQRYAGRVTLAASYDDDTIRQGGLSQFITPNSLLQTQPASIGTVNFWLEPWDFWQEPVKDAGRLHRLGNLFPILKAQSDPDQAEYYNNLKTQYPSFAEATLQAAKLNYFPPKGENIFFYGPGGSFDQVSFSDVLDSENWNSYLEGGKYFKDKIVLIGPTSASLKDFLSTPFGRMAGVEIHANAIATLLENRSIAEAIPNPTLQGLAVFGIVVSAAALQNGVLALVSARRFRRQLKGSLFRFIVAAGMVRFGMAVAIALAWGSIGYVAFISGGVILPTAVPTVAIVLSGVSYFVAASASDYRSKIHLVKILGQFPNSEVVQRILSEYVEFQDLFEEPEQQVFGKKLGGRYQINRILGSGGFGKTYVAEDLNRPGNPLCVVKQLKPASDNPNLLQLAGRLFNREAQSLEELGKSHSQIPQLLAYFEEEGEFYMVQEFIRGKPLSHELSLPGKQLPEARVIAILQDLLGILSFVHDNKVIHRDIKPSNIIWRESDGKLVLIDFGAVKISPQQGDDEQNSETVGIGTKGYMPNEQSGGKPRPNSDIYAVGMIGIQALTGLFPSKLREREDPRTGEILWRDKARVSQALADVLDKMVRYDYRRRYQAASEVLDDLSLIPISPIAMAVDEASMPPVISEDSEASIAEFTRPWPQTFGSDSDLPNTEIPSQESDDSTNSG